MQSMLQPIPSSSGSTPAESAIRVILDQPHSESPASTNHSTPALKPDVSFNIEDDIPGLQLDDIQSTVPLDDAPEGNQSLSATIAFPQDSGSPKVTITTSNDNLLIPPTPIMNTPPLNTSDMTIPSTVPFPSTTLPDPSPSTASSALTEGDKLTDLPFSFSAARLQSFARKTAEGTAVSTQDSVSSSLKGQTSMGRRSLESEQSSINGTTHGRGREDTTPKRVSFEGERPSFSSSVRNGIFAASSPPDGKANEIAPSRSPAHQRSQSQSPRRSPSPLRNFLWPLHRSHSREEPFVPIDPYKFSLCSPPNRLRDIFWQVVCQVYRYMLLRLPSTYFTRVCHVFENAEVSRPEVQRMIEGRNKGDPYRWPADHEWVAPNVSPALIRFKESWESFVEGVLREWKTLNVVSALLMSAILSIFQVEGASTSPLTRTTAFLSLVCALMSLVYGCVYTLRFATMKSMYKASKWAEEAQQATSIFWNVWTLLAMPAVWISWSMMFFCVCILDFVWGQPFSPTSSPPRLNRFIRQGNGTEELAISLSPQERLALAPRIVISTMFGLGVVYFILVLRTFARWGDPRPPRDTNISVETGKWTSRTPSPAPPQTLHNESRSNAEMEQDEKLVINERRARSVDSTMV